MTSNLVNVPDSNELQFPVFVKAVKSTKALMATLSECPVAGVAFGDWHKQGRDTTRGRGKIQGDQGELVN